MQREEKKIGEQIVGKIDSLIYLIKKTILLSEEEDRRKLISEGCCVIRELALLLEKILGNNSEYTMSAIRELLRQRLSGDASVVEEGFFEILEEMMLEAETATLERTSNLAQRRVALAATAGGNSFCDEIQKAIFYLFPEVKISKNHRLFGVNLEYYIPSLNIAVIDGASEKGSQVMKDYLCKSCGIRLIRVNTRELNGYREIARYIKRRLRV